MRRFVPVVVLVLTQASNAHASFNGPMCRGELDSLPCHVAWAVVVALFAALNAYDLYVGALLLAACVYLQRRSLPRAVVLSVAPACAAHYLAVLRSLVTYGDAATLHDYRATFWWVLGVLGAGIWLVLAAAPRMERSSQAQQTSID